MDLSTSFNNNAQKEDINSHVISQPKPLNEDTQELEGYKTMKVNFQNDRPLQSSEKRKKI